MVESAQLVSVELPLVVRSLKRVGGPVNGLFKLKLLLRDSAGRRVSPTMSIQRRVVEHCLFGGGLRIEVPRPYVPAVESCLNVPWGAITGDKASAGDRSFRNRNTRRARESVSIAYGFARLGVYSQIFYSVVNPPMH